VKTQVAIAIADEHVLERKRKEYEERVAEWTRRAELAVDKKQDDLARAALERSLSYRRMAASCEQQVEDQRAQVEHLKTALRHRRAARLSTQLRPRQSHRPDQQPRALALADT